MKFPIQFKIIINICVYTFAVIGFMFVSVYIAMNLGLTKASSTIDKQQDSFIDSDEDTMVWSKGEEWQTFVTALKKDELSIKRASEKTGTDPRLIASILAVEQLRLFYTERAIFEQVFAPLKILGVQSQFSWGVMGIKQETAIEIEKRDTSGLLIFETNDIDTERYMRLTDQHDRYYSYLYSGLFIKEIREEWRKAGFPIDDHPGIIATLFNIGFANSVPKTNPQNGGAIIEIDGTSYSFGGLAESIYKSDEFIDIFPKK